MTGNNGAVQTMDIENIGDTISLSGYVIYLLIVVVNFIVILS